MRNTGIPSVPVYRSQHTSTRTARTGTIQATGATDPERGVDEHVLDGEADGALHRRGDFRDFAWAVYLKKTTRGGRGHFSPCQPSQHLHQHFQGTYSIFRTSAQLKTSKEKEKY